MYRTFTLAVMLLLAVGLAPVARAEGEAPLLSETFDAPASVTAWARTIGAFAGDGPESAVSVTGGALLLEGVPETRRWVALERTVEVGAARWVRLSARMRTDAVDQRGGRFRNCNVFLRFPGGPLVAPIVLTGTFPWTPIARRYPVPLGATSVKVGIFLSLPGRAWFDDVTLEAAPGFTEKRSGRYAYRTLPGDAITDKQERFNDESYRIVTAFLGREDAPEVIYHKYPSVEVKAEYTGRGGNAHAGPSEIHSVWGMDRHEIVHVLATTWGDPPALLAEGLAVRLSGAWQNRPVHEGAAKALTDGAWVPLTEIVGSAAFRQRRDEVTYPIAGALVEWILAAHGKEKLRALYGRLRNGAPDEENRRAFQEVLGITLEEADAKLRASLGGAKRGR